MRIHFIHPFARDKKYGKELNATFQMIPDEDWVCILDWDCMFLTHDQIRTVYKYVEEYPNTGMFCAYSNRSGSGGQRYPSVGFSHSDTLLAHHNVAKQLLKNPVQVSKLNESISGYLMLVSKRTWNEIKFSDELEVLHVDRDYAARLISSGKQVLLMQNIYVWHSYRLWGNTKDKSHLL